MNTTVKNLKQVTLWADMVPVKTVIFLVYSIHPYPEYGLELCRRKALMNLKKLDAMHPQSLLELDTEILNEAVRPAGFYNQKTVYLQEISRFFLKLGGEVPTPKELLKLKEVGNETADSIILYAYHQPQFVVDAYTRRIFSHLGVIEENTSYMEVKKIFEARLPRDVPLYQEYHGLIEEHAKRYYQKRPYNEVHLK